MKSIDKPKLRRVLKRKLGCEVEKTHHEYYNVIIDDKLVASTYMSHGTKPKEINRYLLGRMARQLGVKPQDFKKFCSCTIDRETFEGLILENVE